MNRDEKINEILNVISERQSMHIRDYCSNKWGESIEQKKENEIICDTLFEHGLIRTNDRLLHIITPSGLSVVENGGWIKFQNELTRNESREANNILKEQTKLDQEIKLNDFFIKTKWWPLIISAISLLVSFIALFCNSK